MNIEPRLAAITQEAERALAEKFRQFDDISFKNTLRVINSFSENRVSEACFAGTTGYGYDDRGREVLDRIYADVFGAEAAFARHSIVNGTQALTIALFGLLRPGDIMLSVTSKPYDTLDEVIGISGGGNGSLSDFGVEYRQVDFTPDGEVDRDGVIRAIKDGCGRIKVVFIQRSRGYMDRRPLSAEQTGELAALVKSLCDAYVVVDNCYGEFVCESEPTAAGADLIVGSLIKNPGGGMAESGGYIAGRARAVELCSYRLTCPGIGLECGATLGQNKNMYKGLFYAPHAVASALKTAALAAYIFEKLGYEVSPRWCDERYDIIQVIQLRSPQSLCAFCRGIQAGSPVDAYVTPEPWAMPGYSDDVIMAAGTFTSGSSIELSADGPLRPPYTAFFQGGVTYESGKIGILRAADMIIKQNGKGLIL